MNGIDKIITRIITDAEEYAKNIISDAEIAAEDIIADAETAAAAARNRAKKQIEGECSDIMARAESAAVTERRNIILSEKSDIIDSVFENAKKRIAGLPQADYNKFLASVLDSVIENADKYDIPENEEFIISFNKKDQIIGQEMIKPYGKRIRAEETPALIDGGFIIKRGDITVNCSVSVMVDSYRESLETKLCSILFKNVDIR